MDTPYILLQVWIGPNLITSRLSANDAGQQRVTDESIRDTLMDLANYAIMTILEMDMEKGAKMLDPNAACMAIERLRSPQ